MSVDAMSLHPFLAHFPVALTLVALAFAVGGVVDPKAFRRDLAVTLAVVTLTGAAISGPVTAITGWLAQTPAQEWSTFMEAEPVLDIHRLLGIVFAVAAPVFGAFMVLNYGQRERSSYRAGVLVTALLLSALVLATGYYGAQLVFQHGIAVLPAK